MIAGKEACMVTFLHHHKCDRWLVVWLEWCTSLSDGIKLIKEDLIELPFTYTIPATMDELTMNFHMQHLTGSRRVPPITSRCLQCVITALNIAEDSECPKSIQHWYPPAYEMKTSVTHFLTANTLENWVLVRQGKPVKDDALRLLMCCSPKRY